jgi:hypothetical protein
MEISSMKTFTTMMRLSMEFSTDEAVVNCISFCMELHVSYRKYLWFVHASFVF